MKVPKERKQAKKACQQFNISGKRKLVTGGLTENKAMSPNPNKPNSRPVTNDDSHTNAKRKMPGIIYDNSVTIPRAKLATSKKGIKNGIRKV